MTSRKETSHRGAQSCTEDSDAGDCVSTPETATVPNAIELRVISLYAKLI